MNIPERLYRLARGKIDELLDPPDRDIDPELLAKLERAKARSSAKQELDDALNGSVSPAPPVSSAERLRTPEEIRQGVRLPQQPAPSAAPSNDPLTVHYQTLGIEPGADFATVQHVYEKLAERCRADRFVPGSREAEEAQAIRERLDRTYKALRVALDPTARRFDLLEL